MKRVYLLKPMPIYRYTYLLRLAMLCSGLPQYNNKRLQQYIHAHMGDDNPAPDSLTYSQNVFGSKFKYQIHN